MSEPLPQVLRDKLGRWQVLALVIGVIALAVSCLMFLWSPQVFWEAYLVAWVFMIGLPVGCSAILMTHHMVGGEWGLPIEGLLEAGGRTLPVICLLGIPLIFVVNRLYIWAGASLPDAHITGNKAIYLNTPFFLARAGLYIGLWLLGGWLLNRWNNAWHDSGSEVLRVRLRRLCAPGLVIYVLTMTMASVDWIMSLNPHFYSTIWGMVVVIGQCMFAMALMIVIYCLSKSYHPPSDAFRPKVLHDLSTLLLMCVVLWAYFSFSQFLIYYYGNLPEEMTWYLPRVRGAWKWVSIALIVFHFCVPMAVLLSRLGKSMTSYMIWISASLIAVQLLDTMWLMIPSWSQMPEYRPSWIVGWTVLIAIGMMSIWLALFFRTFQQQGFRAGSMTSDGRVMAASHG